MKTTLLIASLLLLSFHTWSQENIVTLSGGYSFATIEDTDVKATGFRINGLYEFNPQGGILAHGISVGYISMSAEETALAQTISYKINSFPVYYAPKVMFGSDKFKVFIKGALGAQFAWFKREGMAVELKDNDFGFYGGGGGGLMYFVKENIFVNAEYEIAWASNAWYQDGWINTAMGGIGIRF
jgi:hypothetical protein